MRSSWCYDKASNSEEKDILFIELLENILEASVITLEYSVLGAHVQRQALHQGILKAGMGVTMDALS